MNDLQNTANAQKSLLNKKVHFLFLDGLRGVADISVVRFWNKKV